MKMINQEKKPEEYDDACCDKWDKYRRLMGMHLKPYNGERRDQVEGSNECPVANTVSGARISELDLIRLNGKLKYRGRLSQEEIQACLEGAKELFPNQHTQNI